MPRQLGVLKNELRLHDNLSDSDIVLYYRMPTTEEYAGYSNTAMKRKGNKVRFAVGKARLKYGARILIGIRSGDFERNENGRFVPMASDPDDPYYYPGWKTEVVKNASDLVMLLAASVFDNSAEVEDDEEEEIETGESVEESEDDGEDAEKNLE